MKILPSKDGNPGGRGGCLKLEILSGGGGAVLEIREEGGD